MMLYLRRAGSFRSSGQSCRILYLDRQDPQIQKEVMGMRLPAYNAPANKFIKISLPWLSSTFPIVGRIHGIVRGRLIKFLKPRHPTSLGTRKVFFGAPATIPITLLSQLDQVSDTLVGHSL